MTRKSAWIVGLTASSLATYALWRAWRKPTVREVASQRMWDEDEAVNEASEESFPASDAPSHTPMTGSHVV
jgi:hypothetical protein